MSEAPTEDERDNEVQQEADKVSGAPEEEDENMEDYVERVKEEFEKLTEGDATPEPSDPIAPDGRTLKPLPKNMAWMPRDSWEAVPPIDWLPLKRRPRKVYYCMTGGLNCDNPTKCIKRIKKIQKDHMKVFKLPDIAYNFVVGGDGRVYEGRGFQAQPTLPGYEGDQHKAYAVGYIGKFCKKNPIPWDLQNTGEEFVGWLYKSGFLSSDYDTLWKVNPKEKRGGKRKAIL